MQKNETKNTHNNLEEGFIMKPYIDWCFKELMRNPQTRKGFIAELLKMRPEQIGETIILENELSKQSDEEKKGILDVHVLLNNKVQLDIEMQVVYIAYWNDRSLFYVSKMLSSQLKEGDSYDDIQKCIQVGVLNFIYFKKDDICHRTVRLYDEETGNLYSEKLEIQILELPKIPPEYHDPGGVIAWMKFFRGGNRKELKAMAKGNTYLEGAYEDLVKMSQDEAKRLQYEARERALRDQLALQRQADLSFRQLSEAQAELAELQKQFSRSKEELLKTQKKLSLAKDQLSETKDQLSETKDQLSETKDQLSETKDQLSETKDQLSETKDQLSETKDQLLSARERGRQDTVLDFFRKGLLSSEQAASELNLSPEEFQKLLS